MQPAGLKPASVGNERDVHERSGASTRDLLETFHVLARAAAQMRDKWQAYFSFFCRSFFGTFLLVRFRKSGEVFINSVMWPARSHAAGCSEYQDEIFYEFSQPPSRFDDAMLTRD